MNPTPEFHEPPEALGLGEAAAIVVAYVASACLVVVGGLVAWRWLFP